LSVGRKSLDLGPLFAKLAQLGCTSLTADFKRFWRILGYKFNRISCSLGSGFPLDMVKISGHSATVVSPYEPYELG